MGRPHRNGAQYALSESSSAVTVGPPIAKGGNENREVEPGHPPPHPIGVENPHTLDGTILSVHVEHSTATPLPPAMTYSKTCPSLPQARLC